MYVRDDPDPLTIISDATSLCHLQTVSERLSQHVLSNYSKFVAGVTEVASVERDLQVCIPPFHHRKKPMSVPCILCLIWVLSAVQLSQTSGTEGTP